MLSFFRHLLPAILVVAIASPAWADPDFLAAREAYAKGQSERLARLVAKMDDRHPLASYPRYWALKRARADSHAHAAYVERFPDSPLAERLRVELARMAGERDDWIGVKQWTALVARPDNELRCLGLRADLASGRPEAARQGAAMYRTGRDMPSACGKLFSQLFERGQLTQEDRLSRLRQALEVGNIRLAGELNGHLPESMAMASDILAGIQRRPEDMIVPASDNAGQREATLYALGRLAKSDPHKAASLWRQHQDTYSEADRQYGWGMIATEATKQLVPEAADWFALSGPRPTEIQAAWKARALLRAGRWQEVYHAIRAMPEDMQAEAVWRYWQARALKAMGATSAANTLFARLSGEFHYYGLLAEEELPVRLETQPADASVRHDQVQAARDHPGLDRALRLRRMKLMTEATEEWNWAIRGMDDAQLLAAAELARQEAWYDRAINTAERTRHHHNFDLRYLTPYRDLAEAYSREHDLDPAWVFGLMRQESRFVDYARSSAGAQGLMQIMPATAKWIAQQKGLGRNAHARVTEPETNIRFGTFYLRNILDRLDRSPVLATAGYNAGPGRARRWQADTPLEGAIYVESIPFTETREYVKKVLANAMYYSHRLDTRRDRLKDRLGVVPARASRQVAGPASPAPGG